MSRPSGPRPGWRRRRVAAVAALLAAVLAALPEAGATPQLPGHPAPDALGMLARALGCSELDARCLASAPQRRMGPSLPQAVPTVPGAPAPSSAGAACPGPGTPAPAQDDWCERWVTGRGLGPHGVTEFPYAISSSPDGSELYVLARAAHADDPLGAAILVFDASTGSWRRTLEIPWRLLGQDSEFYPILLQASPDGTTLFVVGGVDEREEIPEGFSNHRNILTAAYSVSGELRWWARYRGPMSGRGGWQNVDWPTALEVSPDGSRVYVAGVSTGTGPYQGTTPPYDAATVSYDAATGEQRWLERFDGGPPELPHAVALSHDGLTAYVGVVSSDSTSTVLAYRDDPAAKGPRLAWSHTEDAERFIAPMGLAATADGVVVGGISLATATTTYWDYGLVALGADGVPRWRASHSNVYAVAGTDYTSYDLPTAMVVDGDRVFMTGIGLEWDLLYALGDPSSALVASTAAFELRTGKLSWSHAYRFPGHRIHYPTDIHASGGRVAVVGIDSECNFFVTNANYYCKSKIVNLVTLEYDPALGTLRRAARFNHGGGVATEAARLSLPTSPGYNWIAQSSAGPGDRLYVTALFDSPCLDECLPGARYRLGVLGY